MNNAIYKVKSELIFDDESRPSKRFLHPCVPFAKLEGWMKSPQEGNEQSTNSSEKEFTLEEIAEHDKIGDAWVILNNKIFDVTSVLNWHPGGKNAIMNYAGKASIDATIQYNGIHDSYANGKRDECYLGVLSQKGIELMKKDAERAEHVKQREDQARKRFSLQKHFWTPIKLEKVEQLSRDTKIYTFR
jgi:nitrate reductase (NAD(P)H)